MMTDNKLDGAAKSKTLRTFLSCLLHLGAQCDRDSGDATYWACYLSAPPDTEDEAAVWLRGIRDLLVADDGEICDTLAAAMETVLLADLLKRQP